MRKRKTNKAGQWNKLTRSLILKAKRVGATNEQAAAHGQISKVTLYQWLSDGEEGKSPDKVRFYTKFQMAKPRGIVARLLRLDEAGNHGNVMADLEFLKKQDRKHWGDNMERDRLIQKLIPQLTERLKEEARKSLQVTPINAEEIKQLSPEEPKKDD